MFWPWKKKAASAKETTAVPESVPADFVQSQVVEIGTHGKTVTLLTQALRAGETVELVRTWTVGDGPRVEIHDGGALSQGQYQCPWQSAMRCLRRRLFVCQN